MLDDTSIVDDFNITEEEIEKYNDKITRYERKDTEGLPHRISASEIERMDDAEKFRLKQDISDFLERDSMRIDKASGERKWLKRKYDRVFDESQKLQEEMASYLEPSTEKGTMGAIAKLNLSPKQNHFDDMTPSQRRKSLAGMEVQLSKNQPETYKQNFLKALETEFGKRNVNYEAIKNIVDRMDGKVLYALYAENSDLQIDFIYSQGEQAELRAQMILDALYEQGFSVVDKEGNPVEKEEADIEMLEENLKRMFGFE